MGVWNRWLVSRLEIVSRTLLQYASLEGLYPRGCPQALKSKFDLPRVHQPLG